MGADEARGTGVTANCVVPSIIDTPGTRGATPDADHASWPKISDVAQAYLFLASPAAQLLVSGAAVPVGARTLSTKGVETPAGRCRMTARSFPRPDARPCLARARVPSRLAAAGLVLMFAAGRLDDAKASRGGSPLRSPW